MTTDILEKLDSEKPFRSIEMPEEFLESILLIPATQGPCPFAPAIKIDRELSHEQIEEMMAHEEIQFKSLCRALDIDGIGPVQTPTFGDTLIRKDLYLLAEIVATSFYSKIRKQKPDWINLCQVVEIDWTMRNFYAGEQALHYEIFTKREIRIRTK